MCRDVFPDRPLPLPLREFPLLVERTGPVAGCVRIVVADGVVADLPVDIDVSPRFAGYRVGWVCAIAKREVHRLVLGVVVGVEAGTNEVGVRTRHFQPMLVGVGFDALAVVVG